MADWDHYFQKSLIRYVKAYKLREEGRKPEQKRTLTQKKKDAVYRFYGRQCVICDGCTALDVNHINEDHTDDDFANLIPLCCGANQGIERDDYSTHPDLADEVEPTNIRARAREHFRLGQYLQAYACNSLAAYLYESRKQDVTSAVESLVFSIAALRPLGHRELLVDTVAHCIYLFRIAGRSMSSFWKADFLSQVGLVLYDFGAPQEALECELKAIDLYSQVTSSDHPETREERKARGLKREALVHVPFLTTKRKTRAFDIINEAKQVARKTHDGQALVSASWVEATLKSYIGQTTKSLDVVKESLTLEVKADKWTLVGLHIQAARDYQRLGNKKNAINHYKSACELCEKHKIIPIPLPCNGALIVFDPGLESRLLGSDEAKLISSRKPNPFTMGIMKELFSVIAGI